MIVPSSDGLALTPLALERTVSRIVTLLFAGESLVSTIARTLRQEPG